jgi:hypothetical protein
MRKYRISLFVTTSKAFGSIQGSKGSVLKGLPYANHAVAMRKRVPEIDVKRYFKCENTEFRRSRQRAQRLGRSRGRKKAYGKGFHTQNESYAYLQPFRRYTPKSVQHSKNHIPHYSINSPPNRMSRGSKESVFRVDLIAV